MCHLIFTTTCLRWPKQGLLFSLLKSRGTKINLICSLPVNSRGVIWSSIDHFQHTRYVTGDFKNTDASSPQIKISQDRSMHFEKLSGNSEIHQEVWSAADPITELQEWTPSQLNLSQPTAAKLKLIGPWALGPFVNSHWSANGEANIMWFLKPPNHKQHLRVHQNMGWLPSNKIKALLRGLSPDQNP